MSSEQHHRSDPRILNRRTVERDHRGLMEDLRPGMHVLDIGCGTGAITSGIAKLVGPDGGVTGVDRDESLLSLARTEHAAISNLSFEVQDVLEMPYTNQFDVVSAARVLQWIGKPLDALQRMKAAAKPGGLVVILDYNHSENTWEPDPPSSFNKFYKAFLEWRVANGWSNRIAAELPDLLRNAGISVVRIANCDEVIERGQQDFDQAASIWADVAESLGPTMVTAGYLTETHCAEAAQSYRDWITTDLARQTLCLRTITGSVPA